MLVATPGKPNNIYKVFGAKPLEDVIKNLRNMVMDELDSALAQQAPPKVQDDPSLFELPPLIIDGIPTPVEKMTQAQLRAFIPLMLKYSTGKKTLKCIEKKFNFMFVKVEESRVGVATQHVPNGGQRNSRGRTFAWTPEQKKRNRKSAGLTRCGRSSSTATNITDERICCRLSPRRTRRQTQSRPPMPT